MLTTLEIKNYILIEYLRIDFSEGLNVFTGETGAGKSIIFDAIGLLMGQKLSSAAIRKDSNQCILSAVFDITSMNNDSLKKLLSERSIIDNGELIIRREIEQNGRCRNYINDTIVSVNFLSELGDFLVDIHGQHQHQSLLKNAFQRNYLDKYADTSSELANYLKHYCEWNELKDKLEKLNLNSQEKERLIDLYKFQVKEIISVNPQVGEDEKIKELLPQLKNSGKLRELLSLMSAAIYADENSAIAVVGAVKKNAANAVSLGANLSGQLDTLEEISAKLELVKEGIFECLDSLGEFDENKIDETIGRLDKIEKLSRKYGPGISAVLEYCKKAESELKNLEISDDIKKDIETALDEVEKKLNAYGDKITKKRKLSAEKLSKELCEILRELGMPHARFSVRMEKEPSPTLHGFDKMEFLFSANPGEELRPLREIISGGELSRFMLALKTLGSEEVPVLIFDEIDVGLSGPMGQTVGQKLSMASKKAQVITITHLSQIAAFASSHYIVEKKSGKNTTRTTIRRLSDDESTEEIARMLSGKKITDSALSHARELKKQSLN